LERLRMVIVNHVAQLGGAERVLMNMLQHLDRDSYDAELVFLEEGPLVGQAERLGYRVHVHPSGRLRNPVQFARTVAALRRVIRESRAGLVVNWASKPHMYGGTAAGLERVPAVWWQHGVPGGSLFERIVSRIPARSVICPSDAVSCEQKKINARSRVVIQYPGIEDRQFRFDEAVRDAVRRRYGIQESALVFSYVGRLQRWKRADIVIEAFREALGGKDAHLLIVGGALFGVDKEVEDELRKLVRKYDLDGQVTFTGHQSRIEPYMWASDIIVHSSLFEPFGMVIIEAMASGRIVLAVNRGGPAEIIRHGTDGLLYDGSVRQLADNMEQIWRHRSRYEDMSAAAVETVRRRFSAGVMTEGFQRLVETAAARAGGGGE